MKRYGCRIMPPWGLRVKKKEEIKLSLGFLFMGTRVRIPKTSPPTQSAHKHHVAHMEIGASVKILDRPTHHKDC
jgi:hypothetical protein